MVHKALLAAAIFMMADDPVRVTDVRGQFSIEPAPVSTQLVVVAPGFAPAPFPVSPKTPNTALKIVREPASMTMRGVSASGASRTLVLAGGVLLNDPFGGWVYWGRVPQAAIERIEVVRGGMSDLYGADAVGGVIHIVTLAGVFWP